MTPLSAATPPAARSSGANSSDTPARDYAADVAGDSGDRAYIVGYTRGSLAGWRGATDAFIRTYSPGGSVQWTRQHDFGFDDEEGTAVAVSGSRVYLTGYATRSLRDEKTYYFVPVVKYTTGGTKVWEKRFLGTGFDGQDFVSDASTDTDGNLYLAGDTLAMGSVVEPDPPGASVDADVLKLSPAGTQRWLKRQSTSASDKATAVVARSPTQLYVAGFSEGELGPVNSGGADAFLVRLGGSGGTVWIDQ